MKLAVVNLTGGGISGGYKAYLQNVLPKLARHSAIEAVYCFSPQTFYATQWLPFEGKLYMQSCAPASLRSLVHWPDRALVASIRQLRPDIVFIPVGRYVYVPEVPIVNMVQNMGPLIPHVTHNPWSEKIRYAIQRYEVRYSAIHADHVIAPSNFVRNFLMQCWGIPSDRVTTIHYGLSNGAEQQNNRPLIIPKDWAGHFVFTAGSIEPYRGLEDVIDALPSVLSQKEIYGLVIAGYARENMRSYRRALQKRIDRQGNSHRVIWTGTLTPEEMSWCYLNTSIFVMTSRIESFAMIGLEAMAHGCLCVIADNPPLPEIFSSAATYYHPSDSTDLVLKLNNLLQCSPMGRLELQQKSRQRALEFSWDENIEKLISVFQTAITNRNTL